MPVFPEGNLLVKEPGFKHPGDINFVPLVERGKFLTFEQFKPFISDQNLNSKTALSFPLFLQDLFDKTHHLWLPTLCHESLRIAKSAREIAPNYFPKSTKVKIHVFGNDHMWTVIQIPNQKELIVDPAGAMEEEVKKILPYFGTIAGCSTDKFPRFESRRIYNNSGELTISQERNLLKYIKCFEASELLGKFLDQSSA